MTEEKTYKIFDTILTSALHPLAASSIVTVLLLFGSSIFSIIHPSVKIFLAITVILGTFVIPMLSISLTDKMKITEKFNLSDKSRRALGMTIVTLCYATSVYMLSDIMMAFLITKVINALFACILTAFAIGFFWNISFHMITIGGIVAIMTIINISGFASLRIALICFIILSGLLASSRLYSGQHNLTQIAAGFAVGLGIGFIAILFL